MTFVLSLLPLPTFSQENISPPSSMMIRSPLQELHGRGILICRVSPGCGGAAARMFPARAGAGAGAVVLMWCWWPPHGAGAEHQLGPIVRCHSRCGAVA